jgi:hypothetical protein
MGSLIITVLGQDNLPRLLPFSCRSGRRPRSRGPRRDLDAAARTIETGRVLAIDLGMVGGRYFLESAGVGLDAGLLAYFARLDEHLLPLSRALRAVWRFIRNLGTPPIESAVLRRSRVITRHLDGLGPQSSTGIARHRAAATADLYWGHHASGWASATELGTPGMRG